MTQRTTTFLLVGFVLMAAAAVSWWLLRGSDDDLGAGAANPSTGSDAPSDAVAKARLAGSPVERKALTLEELVARMTYEGDDAEARSEIAKRGGAQADVVATLVGYLALSYYELRELGLMRHQVLAALRAIGRPAAAPLAGAVFSSKYGWTFDILAVLESMGEDAAPAVAVFLEKWSEDPRIQPTLIGVFRAVGPEARAALPLLFEALTPPVDDRLAPTAGAAVLGISGGSAEAIDAIRSVFYDEETLARPALLHQLGGYPAGGEALVPVLVDLLQDPERPTQTAAAFALGRIGVANKDVLLGLVNLLADGTQQGQRQAAEALSALGEEGATLLVQVAREAVDVDDRLAAFNGLIRTGADAAAHVSVLLGILDEDVERDWKIRALGTLSAMDPLPEPAVVLPHLLRALADERLAQAALSVCCRLPGEEARAAIRAHLAATEDTEAALQVMEALARRRVVEPEATAMLLEIARRENDADLLVRVFLGLASANPKADAAVALPLIEPHLDAKGHGLRQSAWRALIALDGEDERVFAHCMRALAEKNYYESTLASQSLLTKPERAAESVPAIIDCVARLASESGYIPGELIKALQRLGPKWSGTTKALDKAMTNANDRGRLILTSLRKRYGL